MAGLIPRKNPAANAPAADTKTATPAADKQAPAAETAATSTPGPAAQPQPQTSTAVAAVQSTAVGAVRAKPVDVIKDTFKDAFQVDWNTLHRIQAVQGSFVDVENNKAEIGKTVVLELLSYQDNWQISPGTDDDADAQHVRYSNDGITTTLGENCAEFLAALKTAEYVNAKMGHRCTLAGTILLVDGADSHDMVNKMVQIDLPPTSKTMFDRHRLQVSMDVGKGIRTPDSAGALKMTAKSQTKGRNTWTVVEFTYA